MSTELSLIRRSVSQVLVVTVLALALGPTAKGQGPTIEPRQVAAAELAYELPIWETHVAMGPSRAVAVFNAGDRIHQRYVRVGYAVYSLSTHTWTAQGIIDEAAGTADDGSVVTYERVVAEGGDEGEGDSGPVLVHGFVAAGLHSDLGGITVASMEGSATSFSQWRIAARPQFRPRLDKPWLIKGNSSGSELYLVYRRGSNNLGYARSRDFGATWYPGPDSDLDLIQVGEETVIAGLGPYGAAVENGNLYIAYDRGDGQIGLLEGVDQGDGSVVFNHLLENDETVLALSRNRPSNDYGDAIPCMLTYGLGPVYSWAQIAVLPGTPTTLIVVYHDTPSPTSRELKCYSVRVRKEGQYWQVIDPLPVLVHPDDPLIDDDQFLPAVTVDSAGRVLVVSYDDRNYRTQLDYGDPECGEPWNSDLDVYLAYSIDGGETFERPDLELCRNPQDMCNRSGIPSPMAVDFSARLYPYYYIGEYIGIASRGNRFIAVFNGTDRTVNPNRDKTVIWALRAVSRPLDRGAQAMRGLSLRLAGVVALWAVSNFALAQCELQRFVEDGGWEEALGWCVGINDRFLMLACPADDMGENAPGSIYVFRRGHRRWEFSEKLWRFSEGSSGFPAAVALHDQRLLAGAPWDDGKVRWSGAAYIFDYVDGRWTERAKLLAQDGFYSQRFGQCVALRGDRALIGAPNGNSAYLFERDADGVWRQVFKFYNPVDGLGADSVALGDGLVVIGDPDDFQKGNWSGAVSVFDEQPDGTWGPEIKLTASDGRGFWGFGVALALRNDTMFVGAPSVADAVYVFKQDRSTGAWREIAILKPSDPNNSARFGFALAVSARTLIVGDSANKRNGVAYGAAYVFVEQDDGEWYEVGKLIASDGAPQDNFGYAVAVYGNEAVIGAPEKNGENYREGAAYLYAVGPDDDGDGVMDACECPGDLDGDRDVDLADLAALLSCLGRGENCADVDEDGRTDGADLAALLAHFGKSCP